MGKITKFRRSPAGHWTANLGGQPVCNRFGCWGTPPDRDGRWREVMPEHARRLAERRKAEERREGKAATA
jgi:hypothetical protein